MKPIADIVWFYYSENWSISENTGAYESIDNPRCPTDYAPHPHPTEKKINTATWGGGQRGWILVTRSTSLSIAEGEGKEGVYLAFSIVSNFLFPTINVNLRLHEVMSFVRRMSVTEKINKFQFFPPNPHN